MRLQKFFVLFIIIGLGNAQVKWKIVSSNQNELIIHLESKISSLEDLNSLKFDTQLTISEKVVEQTGIIGENPLPMGGRYDIDVDYRNSNQMRRIVRDIRHLEGVDVASFQQGIISRVDSIVENILGISMAMGIAIFITAVILVSNTIRLIIHAKQETIETMHLLGATNSFIRFPFVVEGIIQGILGAGFSLLILYLLRSLQSYLLEPLIKLPLVEPANLIAYNFIFGLLLALIGSYRGISKYLPK